MRWFVFSISLCRPLLLFWCFANCQLSFLVKLGGEDLDLELRWGDSHSTHLWNTKRSCWCGIAWKRERKMVKYWRSWALHSFSLLPDQMIFISVPPNACFSVIGMSTNSSIHSLPCTASLFPLVEGKKRPLDTSPQWCYCCCLKWSLSPKFCIPGAKAKLPAG